MTASAQASWTQAAGAAARTGTRDGVIDTLRGIAILMVIGIHSLPKAEGSALVVALDAALRPCVPIFLFVSGFLTASSGQVPLAKRLRRALEPYTIAFIGAYAFMAAENPAMDHRPVVAIARYVLAYVFVYYYVFVYIGCTLALWTLTVSAGHGRGRERRLAFLLAVSIVFGLVCGAYLDPLLQRLGASPSLIDEARLRDLPFWFAFMAAGMLAGLFRGEDVFGAYRYPLAAMALAAYGLYAAIRIAGIGDAAAYDSLAFFLYALLVCLALLGFRPDWSALAALGAASYFVYLWHIFVIMALRNVPALQVHPAISTGVEFVAALSASAALVWLLRQLAPPRVAHGLGV